MTTEARFGLAAQFPIKVSPPAPKAEEPLTPNDDFCVNVPGYPHSLSGRLVKLSRVFWDQDAVSNPRFHVTFLGGISVGIGTLLMVNGHKIGPAGTHILVQPIDHITKTPIGTEVEVDPFNLTMPVDARKDDLKPSSAAPILLL